MWVYREGEANVEASRSRATSPDAPASKRPLDLSTDGSTAIFSTAERLTDEDTDLSTDLYAYGIGDDSLELVSRGAGGSGNTDACAAPSPAYGPGCGAILLALSDDGRYVYFASPELLDGAQGTENANNLYVFDRATRETSYITGLASSDLAVEWAGGASGSGIAATRSIASNKLAFLTSAPQPGYENNGHSELYLYEPEGQRLVRASCRPDGAPAQGDVELITNNTGGWLRPLNGTADGRLSSAAATASARATSTSASTSTSSTRRAGRSACSHPAGPAMKLAT